MLVIALTAHAAAADLVWLGEVPDDAARVAAQVGAEPRAYDLWDLIGAPHARTPADDAALSGLVAAIRSHRS